MGKFIDAISVPNDGPLKAKNESLGEIDVGVHEALNLLKNQNENVEVPGLEMKTIQHLKAASSLRDQLCCLRAYRSSILNFQNAKNKEVVVTPDLNHRIGMYRILLEFGFSESTPHPLKRASESCLSALSSSAADSSEASVYDEINRAVVRSLLDSDSTFRFWSSPIQTLFDMLSFEPTLSIALSCEDFVLLILQLLSSGGTDIKDTLKDHYYSKYEQQNGYENGDINKVGVVDVNVLQSIEKGVEICVTLKLYLAVKNQDKIIAKIDSNAILKSLLTRLLRHIVIPLVRCQATSSESLFVCSVVFAQLLLLRWKLDQINDKDIAKKAGDLVSTVVSEDCTGKIDDYDDYDAEEMADLLKSLPQLNQVAIIKGLVGTLPEDILSENSAVINDDLLLVEQMADFILNVANVSTENGARLLALKGLDTVMGRWKTILTIPKEGFGERARKLSNKVLHVALSTWESPPSRQIGCAVPGVFQSLVKVMEILDSDQNKGAENSIDFLVTRILSQPSSRKGKYVALEALLPKIGAKKMIMLSESQSDKSSSLISSFISEIGRGGNSSGAVAELLAKTLSSLRSEMHRDAEGNKKERRKKEGEMLSMTSEKVGEKEEILLLDEWNICWTPVLANALLHSESSFRKNVASFCLPLLVKFVGGKGNRIDASHAFAIILNEISSKGGYNSEALIWAKFEVVRYADLSKLLKWNSTSSILKRAISAALPFDLLKSTLFHQEPRLRLTAFQSIAPIIFTYDNDIKDPVYYISIEIGLWKEALPYAFKCSDKEYLVSLIRSLRTFLDRISDQDSKSRIPLLLGFVIDFLLQDLFVKQAAYPGTVSEKEKWALSMINCIVEFATQHKLLHSKKKESNKHLIARNVPDDQKKLYFQIMENVIGDNVLSTLITLMNSMWDSTRSCAHEIILNIIQYAKEDEVQLPKFLARDKSVDLFQARAIHLASSPRQREADTGARMISLVCAIKKTQDERLNYLKMLSDLLVERIEMMEVTLGLAAVNECGVKRNILPLAHGLIQSVRLIVETWGLSDLQNGKEVYEDAIKTCVRAIEVSLVVVADVKNVDEEGNMDNSDQRRREQDRWKMKRAKTTNIPLNVNTGAIGANASFASLNPADNDEKKMRLVRQRIIMGTWLLIREGCSALSSIIASSRVKDLDQISNAGNLLISTLTSLKHQGAAFAAHKALQKLCTICSSASESDIRLLPSKWSRQLLNEITSTEIVRDSTLRRSTGYGLGFLSILRSEQTSPKFLFPFVLSNILMISLPPSSVMNGFMQRWNVMDHEMFVFPKSLGTIRGDYFVGDQSYEERSRVHALNILRLVILDAPLATRMREFVGDSIIVSLIGYKDSSWAVRNSATMCFAAAMLRVVDADKNADMVYGNKNSKRTTNAVTCKELFRSYPPLATCMLSLIQEENATGSLGGSVHQENATGSLDGSVHPVLFPLLLLIARLQPLSLQRTQFGSDAISKHFIDPITKCLGHIHHKVRIVAARALAVLCSSLHERREILANCVRRLSCNNPDATCTSHNLDHGLLLAMKYLIGSSSDPTEYLDKFTMDAIMIYSTCWNFKFTCPPPCSAIALEIWHIAVSADPKSAMKSKFFVTSFRIVRSVEEISKCNNGNAMIGIVEIAKMASKCACKTAFSYIFEKSSSFETRIRCLQVVEHCFTSENYDIMLHSVKAFKKGIYEIVENIIADEHITESDMNVLRALSKSMMHCILIISNRDGFRAHPPTLRRLSRIALEAINALKSKDETGAMSVTDIVELSSDDLWKISLYLLRIGGYKFHENGLQKKGEEPSGGNPLAGNGLQLASYFMCEMILHQETAVKYEDLFVSLIRQSTHPLTSWKIRHSAAISINESGFIYKSSAGRGKLIYLDLFELCQDSDEDVRKEAGKALFRSSKIPLVSLKYLELASSTVASGFSTTEMFNEILGRFRNICVGIEDKMSTTCREYCQTVQSPGLNSILNLCTARKIFEEEDPNPFLEVLVILHAYIASLCKFPASSFVASDKSSENLFVDIYKTCLGLLNNMLYLLREKKIDCTDIAHNISVDVNIFAHLHGSILGSAFGFWVGIEDKTITAIARDILDLHSSFIHPCIVNVLQLLTTVEKGNETSKNAILQSCFLLPSHT